MSCVKIKAVLTSKSIVKGPFGEKLVKLEFVEEREIPGPVIVHPSGSELAKEIAPIISQIMKSMPLVGQGKVTIPRLTLFLSEEEWDDLIEKPDIGEEVEVEVHGRKVRIEKS